MADWREQYHAAMTALVLRDGTPVRYQTSLYGPADRRLIAQWGWEDGDTAQHFLPADQRWPFEYVREGNPNQDACTPIAPVAAKVVEEHTYQMEGTGYGNDVALVMVHGVSCACGKHTDLTWAVQSTFGDLTLALLNSEMQ